MSCAPLMLTWLASAMLMVRVSVPLLMTILPLPAVMASLKVSTMLLPTDTPVLLSAGLADARVGAALSSVKASAVDAVLTLPAASV